MERTQNDGGLGEQVMKPGHPALVVLAALLFFCILFSYYLLRPMRDELGIRGGVNELRWLWAATTATMLVAAPAFAWLVSVTRKRVFLPLTYHVFAGCMIVFCLLFMTVQDDQTEKSIGYIFYVWLSVMNLFVISVFWGFLADVFDRESAKRWFGPIGVGGTLGAIAGASVPSTLAEGVTIGGLVFKIDPYLLLIPAALLLEAAVVIVMVIERNTRAQRESVSGTRGGAPEAHEPGPDPVEGFRLIAASPYLQTMVVYMLLFTATSSLLYFEQARVIEAAFPERDERTAALARIDLATNVLTLVTQLFVTRQILRYLGVLAGLLVLPILTLVGFGVLEFLPTFGALFVIVVLRRGLHYAVDRPTREVLYTILGPDEKYKSKSFIDTFVYRAGDLAGAWIDGMKEAGGLIWISTGAACAWIGTAGALSWLHGRESRARGPASRS